LNDSYSRWEKLIYDVDEYALEEMILLINRFKNNELNRCLQIKLVHYKHD